MVVSQAACWLNVFPELARFLASMYVCIECAYLLYDSATKVIVVMFSLIPRPIPIPIEKLGMGPGNEASNVS